MVIFRSYVSLPEGIYIILYNVLYIYVQLWSEIAGLEDVIPWNDDPQTKIKIIYFGNTGVHCDVCITWRS